MLTEDQVNEAIEQMVSHCRLSVEAHKQGVGEYEMLAARGVLYTLGYQDDQEVHQILQELWDRGFKYCLDRHFPAKHFDPNNPNAEGDMVTDYPSADACHWGADQLLSRLESYKSHWRKAL